MKPTTEKCSIFWRVAPVVTALIVTIVSVAYIVCRTMSNRTHDKKWIDYDECGLC